MSWVLRLLVGMLVLCFAFAAPAQSPIPAGFKVDAPPAVLDRSETYRLWPGRAPDAAGGGPSETPSLTVFRPGGAANGTAVIVAPGGGYVSLSGTLEGTEPARWFAARGIMAFVLVYRVGRAGMLPIPLADGTRAVRFVRAYAQAFGIDPARIGMMGFSAGGHLAASTAVASSPGNPEAADPVERVSGRPDFLILAYPWLEGMQPVMGHSPYCDFVVDYMHAPCDPRRYAAYVPLRRVTAEAPPTFIYHTSDDGLVPVEGSLRFYAALRAKRVPVEMHVFQTGSHGTGLGGNDAALSQWPTLLQAWMRARALLPAPHVCEHRP